MASVVIGCGSVIPDGDGRYLLVREAKAQARGRWALPAGKLEVGETLAQAAAREALEEAGVEVEIERLLGIWHCLETSEGFAVVNLVFAARIVAGEPTPSEEHPEVGWFTRGEIASLELRGTHIALALDAYERGDTVAPPMQVPPSRVP
jgi:ADP-ribose pyrophosphatase YjhB (NUDIX family)